MAVGGKVKLGDTLGGRYRLDHSLGSGGMAEVFAATHTGLKQQVAIKVLLPQFAADPVYRTRFEREARAAAALQSRHVVTVSDVDVHDGTIPYMVMERLTGCDLASHIRSCAPLSLEEAVAILMPVCEAIQEAHDIGIIHRDLKPANIFLAEDDGERLIKVLDFGISKVSLEAADGKGAASITKSASVMGTPAYMSPEQTKATKDVDARSDVWSLGCILYEMLSGESPYAAESIPEVMVNILTKEPSPLATVRGANATVTQVNVLIARCLQKDREERLGTVEELRVQLGLLADGAGRHRPQPTVMQVPAELHRHQRDQTVAMTPPEERKAKPKRPKKAKSSKARGKSSDLRAKKARSKKRGTRPRLAKRRSSKAPRASIGAGAKSAERDKRIVGVLLVVFAVVALLILLGRG